MRFSRGICTIIIVQVIKRCLTSVYVKSNRCVGTIVCVRINRQWHIRSSVVFLFWTRIWFVSPSLTWHLLRKFQVVIDLKSIICAKRFRLSCPRECPQPSHCQISDAVGSTWIQALKEIRCEDFDKRHEMFPHQTRIRTKPFYRQLFEEMYPGQEHAVYYTGDSTACSSSTAFAWHESFERDPSGLSVSGI